MSVDLNKRIEISTYLNEQNCEKILEQSLASAVKKLSDLVDIENLQNTEKRKCYEQKKKGKINRRIKSFK